MTEEFNEHEEFFQEIDPNKLLELFDELSFSEKWSKVSYGLKQPKDTGAYKWARLQVQRLAAPIAAVVVPIIAVLLLMVFAAMQPPPAPPVEVRIVEPEPIEELEPPEPPEEIEQIEPPDPVEMDFTPDVTTSQDNSPNNGPQADFSPMPASFDSVAIVKSPVIMKGIYGSRSPGARGSAMGKYGGGSGTEGAVMRALRWLKKCQESEGSWPSTKPAMTSLALLAYLAHGETPTSEEFGPTVEMAIRWLVENQTADGRFNGKDGHDYSHPIAAYALSEAYGLTKVPTVKYAAEKAIAIIIGGQHPSGGWDYNCKQSDRDDTSYMGWCAQALKAAYMAGLENPNLKVAMLKAIEGFKKNYSPGSGYGGFGYTSPSSSHGLTGVGTLCMQLLGAAKSAEVKSAIANMENWTYDWGGGGKNQIYYWYYTTQAMFHEGGGTWKNWNAKFFPVLIKNQVIIPKAIQTPDGKMADIGYWINEGEKHRDKGTGEGGGFIMDTCLSALQLMVYYRYLPTFQAPAEIQEAAPVQQNDDIEIEINI